MIDNFKTWFKSGTPWIWLNAGAVSISLLLVLGILGMIMVKGMGHFWIADVYEMQYDDGKAQQRIIIGEKVETAEIPVELYEEVEGKDKPAELEKIERLLVKSGNRDQTSADFQWIYVHNIKVQTTPDNLIKLERLEWGNFYGFLKDVQENGKMIASDEQAWAELNNRFERILQLREKLEDLEKDEISSINYGLERLRLKKRKLELDKEDTPENLKKIEDEVQAYNSEYQSMIKELTVLRNDISRDSANFTIASGKVVNI
ncbi:MAG: phosphate ABC transporter, permease protein PstA, partial [Gammaproteobacteria bacterium]|nr:phosphate ABC transporter, permease protein PstA [Gammaproteobacteria bacterium]